MLWLGTYRRKAAGEALLSFGANSPSRAPHPLRPIFRPKICPVPLSLSELKDRAIRFAQDWRGPST